MLIYLQEAKSLELTGIDFITYIQDRPWEERQCLGDSQKYKLVQREETKWHEN